MLKLKKVEGFLFFLTILFLPTQLGRHFWPGFSYIYSLRIDYLSPTIYFWDLLVLCLITVWLLGKPKVNKLALNLFLFFILTQAVSLTGAANLGAGLVRLEQYLVTGFFGVYIASSKFKVFQEKLPLAGQSSKLYWPLLLGILFESALAIGQSIKGGSLGFWILGERTFSLSTPAIAKFDFYGIEFLRPYGTFPHPNVLAGFTVINTLLLSFLRMQESIYGSRIKYGMTLVCTFFAGLATLLSVSRTAIIAGFVAGLFLMTKKWKMVLVILVLILSPFLYTRFASLFNYDQLTFLRREELFLTAWNIFLKNPLFGAGLNNFIQVSAIDLQIGPSRFLQPVHNIFLLALAETGVLGLLGLLGLIGYPIIKCKVKREKRKAFLLSWGTIIFLGLFDHYFLTLPQGYRLLFLVWGLSFSVLELKDARPT